MDATPQHTPHASTSKLLFLPTIDFEYLPFADSTLPAFIFTSYSLSFFLSTVSLLSYSFRGGLTHYRVTKLLSQGQTAKIMQEVSQ